MLAQFNSLINLLSVFIQGDNRVSYSQALPFIQFVLFGWLQQGGELRAISFQQSFEKLYTVSFSRSIEKKIKSFISVWQQCMLVSQMHAEFTAVLDFYRAMLCIRGTSHGPVSVCLWLSQVGVVLKRQNVSSHKQHDTMPQGL